MSATPGGIPISPIVTMLSHEDPFPCKMIIQRKEYRWANENAHNAMAHPEELEYLGYVKLREHPFYKGSWLMVRDV